MEHVYLTRLSQPHLQISQTHQMFSSFVSTYQNARYEQSLVSSQPIYAATKATVDAREQQEDRLVGLDYSIDGFRAYLEWEQEVSKPDFLLVKVLYERALSIHSADDSLWKGYVTFLVSRGRQFIDARRLGCLLKAFHEQLNASHHPRNFSGAAEAGWPAEPLSEALSRAVRYLPFSGEVVSKCIRGIVSTCRLTRHVKKADLNLGSNRQQESSHPAETAKIFAQGAFQYP